MTSANWPLVRLGEHAKIKHGWAFKSAFFVESTDELPTVVNIGNFKYEGGFRFNETTLKGYDGDYPAEYILSPGDILLVMTCQTSGGEILGIPGRIPDDGNVYLHNQRLGKVVVENTDLVDDAFLYWMFLSPEFNRELFISASGTKILHTAPTRIESYSFHLPPKPEQKAIAHILGTLDDKIELNRQTNKTLESIARAIFKSWFVDFDPVRVKRDGSKNEGDKATPYSLSPDILDLFPDSFQDSELGEIPVGWEVRELGDVSEIFNGYAFKSADYADDGLFVLRTRNFNSEGLVSRATDDVFLPESFYESHSQYICEPFDFHMVMVGASIGKTSLILPHNLPALRNQNMWCFRAKGEVSRAFLRFAVQSLITNVMGWASGSARSFFRKSDFRKHLIIVPSNAVSNNYQSIVEPMYEKISKNSKENDLLTELRDTLLPKLISGELRIKDAEIFLKDAPV